MALARASAMNSSSSAAASYRKATRPAPSLTAMLNDIAAGPGGVSGLRAMAPAETFRLDMPGLHCCLRRPLNESTQMTQPRPRA